MIEPTGFSFDDRAMKRAALDYGPPAHMTRHADWDAFQRDRAQGGSCCSTRSAERLDAFAFQPDDLLLFGSETTGAPEAVHAAADARGDPHHGRRPFGQPGGQRGHRRNFEGAASDRRTAESRACNLIKLKAVACRLECRGARMAETNVYAAIAQARAKDMPARLGFGLFIAAVGWLLIGGVAPFVCTRRCWRASWSTDGSAR